MADKKLSHQEVEEEIRQLHDKLLAKALAGEELSENEKEDLRNTTAQLAGSH